MSSNAHGSVSPDFLYPTSTCGMQIVRPAEHYLYTAAAADLLAMWTVASLTAATDSPSITTSVFGVLILHAVGVIGMSLETEGDVAKCSHALDLSKIPPDTLRARLTLRLAQAMQFSRALAEPPPGDGAAARHVAKGGGDGVITGKAFALGRARRPPPPLTASRADVEQAMDKMWAGSAGAGDPWAVDDAECLQALAAGAWREAPPPAAGVSEEDSFAVLPWPGSRVRPRCVVGPAHARLHAERALAVISVTLATTVASGALSTSSLSLGEDSSPWFPLDRAALAATELPLGSTAHTAHTAYGPTLGDGAAPLPLEVQVRWLQGAAHAAERLLDFLRESTADIGALEFHRGAVNMYAALAIRSLRADASEEQLGSPSELRTEVPAERAERECLLAARAACQSALDWTPFAAVAQRGRCELLLCRAAVCDLC